MDSTGLFLFWTAFGNSLWLQLCRKFSSRNWAGASNRVCSLSGAQTYWDGLIGALFSISWGDKSRLDRVRLCFVEKKENLHYFISLTVNEVSKYKWDTHHKLRFDNKIFLSPNWNVFFHQENVVKAAYQQPAAVHPQIKVHLLTIVPAHDSGGQ